MKLFGIHPSVVSLSLILFLPLAGSAQDFDPDAVLPVNPAIRMGELENGLRYYVRENKKPDGRAILRLVLNAGSIQETEEQRGLAHFIEHMAFNGSTHFEKSDVVDFMEEIGMRFGNHLNASTSFNETIYKLQFPVDDPAVVDRAFLILEDWASGIQFSQEEIDAERGVVIEEWRARKGAASRIREKQYPLTYYGSKYKDRLPIGLVPILESANRDEFLKFYKDWYRPDLMAVIAVGDFDGEAFEKMIVEKFGKIAANPEGPERVSYPIPDHEETLVSIETDPELTSSSLSVLLKTDRKEDKTARDFRASLVEGMYFDLLNSRLGEKVRREDPPYQGAALGRGGLGREKATYRMIVGFLEEAYEKGINAVLDEIDRVARDGFTASEFERLKVNMLRSIERSLAEKDKRSSSSLVGELIRNFTTEEPIPGIDLEMKILKQAVETATLDEVHKAGSIFAQKENRVVLFQGPEKEGSHIPTKEELLAMLDERSGEGLESYDDGVGDQPLMSVAPKPGAIVEEVYHESIDTLDWQLSNGVRVLVKSTDFKNDQILMSAFSPGGHSLVEDDEFYSAVNATGIVGLSGLGEYDAIQLRKKLAGKVAGVSASLSNGYESMSGSASPKDFETMFQLLHMKFVEPRLDYEAFESAMARFIASIKNRLKNPNAVFQDEVTRTLFQGHPRHQPMSEAIVRQIDADLAFEIYKSRFADASDFTFVFVGSIDLELMRKFTRQYLASLPSLGREEEGVFVGDYKKKGQFEVKVAKNLEEKTSVSVSMYGDAEWSIANSFGLGLAREVLNIKMRESLREEAGGVYGVGVSGGLSREPRETFSSGFSFTCEPGNVDTLIGLAWKEIEDLKANGPSEKNMEKVREMRLRANEKGMRENPFWLGQLTGYARLDRDFDEILSAPDRIKAYTAEQVQEAARKYFDDTNKMRALLTPLVEEAIE